MEILRRFPAARAIGGQARVIDAVLAERRRQDAKWGVQRHGPDGWLMILMEEVGEAAKAVLEGSGLKYHDELIQVAAVAVAALESLSMGNLELGSLVKAQQEVRILRAALAERGNIGPGEETKHPANVGLGGPERQGFAAPSSPGATSDKVEP